ncbi:unnamed protein product [Urochloa humidicola]
MAKCSPLHKVTDDARWDAEDLFGRLCIVAHAAFIYAGFHPTAALAATPWSLAASYSVLPPETAAESNQDAAAIVLRLYRPWGRRRRGRAHMSLRAHVVTANNGGRYMEHREQLRRAALESVLAGGLDGAARAIRAPGSAAERLWKLLADGICRGLFLYACEAHGVPVLPDFASLPGDIKMEILNKLEDGKDLAMAECTSKELRSLVADHDSDLWKAKYKAIVSSYPNYFANYPSISITDVMNWKRRYVVASRRSKRLQDELNPEPNPFLRMRQAILREIRMTWITSIQEPRTSIRKVVREARKPTEQRRAEVEEKSHRRSAGRAMTKVPRNRKEHQQAGAVQSSSRYQQKHR